MLRKRPDGYHDIETIFYRVNPFDELSVAPSGEITLECNDQGISSGDNLVHSGAVLLREALGVKEGARIILRKNIPVGAGLGGGSADAAATLRLLCRLWGVSPPEETIRSIALRLGSDVPYFLQNGAARATSRGEVLDPFQLVIPYPIVVVTPDLHVSTGDAYRVVVPNEHGGSDDLKTLLMQHLSLPDLLGGVLRNDFEPHLTGRYPQLRDLRRVIQDSGAVYCSLSGSGSSFFALYPDEPAARGAMEILSDRGKVFYTPPGFMPDLGIREGEVPSRVD